jgi:hypothetical protein
LVLKAISLGTPALRRELLQCIAIGCTPKSGEQATTCGQVRSRAAHARRSLLYAVSRLSKPYSVRNAVSPKLRRVSMIGVAAVHEKKLIGCGVHCARGSRVGREGHT